MSKKDFDVYYKRISDQYFEMKSLLDEYELMSMKNLVSPEQLDNIKKTIQPIKDNYMTISHVAFLLNKPNRKEKQKVYYNQNKKKINSLDKSKDLDSMIINNSTQLDEVRGMIKDGSDS